MNPTAFLQDMLAQFSAAPVGAQLLAKTTLLLAVAWAVHFSLARANPRWRTLLWRGVAAGLVLMTVWIPGLPGLEIRIHAPEPVSAATAPSLPATVAESDQETPAIAHIRRVQGPASVERAATTHPTAVDSPPEAAPSIESSGPSLSWRMALLGIWSIGVALLAIRLAIALLRVARLLRTSQAASEEVAAEVGRIADALGCCRAVQVRVSRGYAVPFQYGLWRPVLLLPERMCQPAYRAQLPAVIAHELAHARSWDFGWNAVMQAVSTVLWFHPLAWRIGSAHRAACDGVCDAVSASYVGDVRAYCRTLAQVALEAAASFPVLALSMARTCDVRRRIALLEKRLFAAALSRRAVGGTAFVGLLSSVLLAGVRFAPTEPPSPGNSAEAPAAAAQSVPVGAASAMKAVSPGTDLYGDPLPPGAIARLGTIRYRFDGGEDMGPFVFAPDGKTVLGLTGIGYGDDSFFWRDATSGKLLRRIGTGGLDSHEGAITPDGKIAATVEASSLIKWWDVAAGKELASIAISQEWSSPPPVLAIAPNGATVVTGDKNDGTVRLWSRTAKTETAVYKTIGSIEAVAFSANGKTVLFVTGKGDVCLWDPASGKKPRTVLTRSKDFLPRTATFSTSGKLLAVGGDNGNVRLLEASDGRLTQTLDWPRSRPSLISIAFSADDKRLAVADYYYPSNHVAVWDLTSGKLLHTFSIGLFCTKGLAFSPDGRLLAVGSNTLEVWDLASGKSLDAEFVGHAPCLGNLVFLGRTDIVATAGCDETVRLWDARTGRQKKLIFRDGIIYGLAVSPDGKLLACSGQGKAVWLGTWDAGTGKPLRELAGLGPEHVPLHLCFSADGKRLAGACRDGKIRVWSVNDWKLLRENALQPRMPELEEISKAVGIDIRMQSCVFALDARSLVTNLSREFRVFNTETGETIRTFLTDGLQQCELAISSDGALLLSNQQADSQALNPDGTLRQLHPTTHALRLWTLADGKEVWHRDLPGAASGPICFSPDGKRFAVFVQGLAREIRVCDLSAPGVVRTLRTDGYPGCLRFSADGRLLVAGMADGTALTWDLAQPSAGH